MPRARHILPWFAVLALLLASTVAAAHDIEHDLGQHDEPSCALHLLANHAGKALTAVVVTVPILPYRAVSPCCVSASSSRAAIYAPHARAPPVSSV